MLDQKQLDNLNEILVKSTASDCLLRFVNNDECADHLPTDESVLAVQSISEEMGLTSRCDRLEQGDICQTIFIIDFPSEQSVRQFESEVCPLPIKFRYEGEWSAGFQFLEPELAAELTRRNLVSVPDGDRLRRMETDPNYVCESVEPLKSLQRVESVSFTMQDHSYAVFPDLMTLDIDHGAKEAIAKIQDHCRAQPEELWAIYTTKNGIHAMRLDMPVTPAKSDSSLMEHWGVDSKYMNLCQQNNQWTARITPKSNRTQDRIRFDSVIGTGVPDPQLSEAIEAYQKTLILNGLDTPDSLNLLQAKLGATQSIDFSPTADTVPPILTVYTDGAAPGNNHGQGGWGAVLMQGDVYWETGGVVPAATNNIAELTAAVSALDQAEKLGLLQPGTSVSLITDSKYVKDGATTWIEGWKNNGWRTSTREPVKNQNLWQKLDTLKSEFNVQFEWVKGHALNEHNNRADQIASKYAKGQTVELEQQMGLKTPAPSLEPLYAPSRQELLAWCMVAGAKGDENLKAEIIKIGGNLRFQYREVTGDQEGTPPMTFTHPSVSLSVEQRQQMEQDLNNAPGAGLYTPSRGELLNWWDTATKKGDAHIAQQVLAIGSQLKTIYQQETGNTEGSPPLEYRHPLVLISAQDKRNMQQALSFQPAQTAEPSIGE